MKGWFIIFTLLCVFVASESRAQQENIIDMYTMADSVGNNPPSPEELTLLCQKRIQRRYVSFIGRKKEHRVLIVAVTLKPFDNPDSALSTAVQFDGIRPSLGKVSTWGYVYDRNGDGKIDYLAIVGGAAALKGKDFPDAFPERSATLTWDQMDLFVRHCRIVFNHWADDNFDGKLDAVVHIDMDPQRDWVDRRIVARSTTFKESLDDVWAFHTDIDAEKDSVQHTSKGFSYHPIGKPSATIDRSTFAEKTGMLQLLNRAAKECNLSANQFAQSPRDR